MNTAAIFTADPFVDEDFGGAEVVDPPLLDVVTTTAVVVDPPAAAVVVEVVELAVVVLAWEAGTLAELNEDFTDDTALLTLLEMEEALLEALLFADEISLETDEIAEEIDEAALDTDDEPLPFNNEANEGNVTPKAAHNWSAYPSVVAWSATLHWAEIHGATEARKEDALQKHAISVAWHPVAVIPVRTQVSAQEWRPESGLDEDEAVVVCPVV